MVQLKENPADFPRSNRRSYPNSRYTQEPVMAMADNILVHMNTSMGTVIMELYPDKAPKTVANFLQYVRDGFYNGTLFHRIIDGFVIQGGGFEPSMTQKPTRGAITNEADNQLRNVRGTVAMARTRDPHSATSQFFINLADNDFLNFSAPTPDGWGYCVFGKVVEGMHVVDRIKGVPTGSRLGHTDIPMSDVVITSIEIVGGE
jgi:peptidyl-prolyl cis-trans isomerase B (cyclophilin B)